MVIRFGFRPAFSELVLRLAYLGPRRRDLFVGGPTLWIVVFWAKEAISHVFGGYYCFAGTAIAVSAFVIFHRRRGDRRDPQAQMPFSPEGGAFPSIARLK